VTAVPPSLELRRHVEERALAAYRQRAAEVGFDCPPWDAESCPRCACSVVLRLSCTDLDAVAVMLTPGRPPRFYPPEECWRGDAA
jgi:hypothetical protein